MNNNELKFVVLQAGKKEPVANQNGGWLLTSDINAYDDLGIYLRNQPEVICIDFDSLEENNGYESEIVEAIQKEFPSNLVVSTDRGIHMYYRTSRKLKTWTKKMLCLGIKTDAKIGNQYAIIKRLGKIRNYTGNLNLNDLTELPEILFPLNSKTAEIQAGITEGNRNTSLFEHLCRIRKFYGDIDLHKIAHFINKYLYNPPMEDTEVDTIVNSVNNQDIKSFETTDEEMSIYQAIDLVLEEDQIHLANNDLYFWNGNHYVNDDFELLNLVYKKHYFGIKDTENIIFQMKMKAPRWNKENVIAIKNGIIKDGKYINEKNVFTPYYIDITYNPNAYCKDFDEFLQFITNNEESEEKNDLRIIIEEMFGHCLMFKDFPHKIFLLVGKGKNGKSVLLNALCHFFKGVYSNVPLNYIDKDHYVARLVNKLANFSDDIDYNYLVSSQNIKKISSGDYISARELYGKSFDFKSTATQIYSMNELVKFKDKSYGMERRLCIIPFKNEVKNVDPHMLDKLITEEAKSYFLNIALQGIERIKNNNYQLSQSKTIDKTLRRYINESDTVEMFFTYGDVDNIEERQFSIIYELYKAFCIDNEYIPCTKNGFSRKLRNKGYITVPRKINGHSVRMIIKEENDE